MNYTNRASSTLQPLIIMVVTVITIFYSVNVLNTGDWFWYQSETIVPRPSSIVIIDHGQKTILATGHSGYSQLADAITESVKQISNSDLIPIGLSEGTLSHYEHDVLVLEVYFDRPLRFHTSFRAGEPTQLLIPLNGRHAGNGYFFRGAQGQWWSGALQMADPAPLYATLSEMGYVVDTGRQ